MKTRLVASLVLAAALSTALATLALGHAALESSDPAGGGKIRTPYTLTATYDEELTPNGSSIVVQNSTGAQVASGTVSATDDKSMTIDLPVLPDGDYEVLWTAVTADDNGITRGTYTFTVEADFTPSGTPPRETNAPEPTTAQATPAPSATDSQTTGSGNDLLLPLAVVVVVVIAIAGYFIYRNRS